MAKIKMSDVGSELAALEHELALISAKNSHITKDRDEWRAKAQHFAGVLRQVQHTLRHATALIGNPARKDLLTYIEHEMVEVDRPKSRKSKKQIAPKRKDEGGVCLHANVRSATLLSGSVVGRCADCGATPDYLDPLDPLDG